MTSTGRDRSIRQSAIRTFLIADIRGYTRFTARLGDEAASRLAGKFAQVVAEGVEAWDGTLVEVRGDEALVVFDSARQALRAAVELQDAFEHETRTDPHLPLAVGIGLDAGEAVAVGDGFRGAALNMAARLCSAAGSGEVNATESLVHLSGPIDGIAFTPLAATRLKGIESPVTAVRVVATAVHDPAPAGAAAAGDQPPLPSELDSIVPLAGRRADRQWLSWHWRRARHGHGRCVALTGPSGIGKTRLLAEIAGVAHEDGAAVLYQTGNHDDKARAFEALTTMPSETLVILDDAERARDAVTDSVARLSQQLDGRPMLLVVAHADSPPATTRHWLARSAPDERRRELAPLDVEAVTEIAALYANPALEAPPVQLILEESDGIPVAVHRVASQWARSAATRRLGTSARRTSRERRDLRTAEAELIGDVANLEMARERSRLYVETAESEPAAQRPVLICPYKGLAAFEAADAEYYFGRERLVAELIARLVGASFAGLVGASGSGKSSALQAGLLPALADGVLPGSDQWIQIKVRPGDHPDRELRSALARGLPARPEIANDPRQSLDVALDQRAPAQRVLLVIDQFEEIFTAAEDEAERRDFIDLITEPRAGLKVLLAVRADHYERCAAYPRLATLIGANQVLVGPLATPEIESIIRHPADRAGLRADPDLVAALVADVGTEPGGLPLLSTALLELWEARDAGRLTLAAYRAAGGVRGAVARLAEAAYGQLDPSEQAVARAIFLRLAGPGDGTAVVGRRVPLAELDAGRDAPTATVLEALTAARLLTAGDGNVEVAHEALLREWPRLRGWLEEDTAGRQVRLHLAAAAREWEESGREEGDLYRGARLAAASDWSADHGVELNASEHQFLNESRALSERETDRQRRANRILRMLLAGAAVFLVLAIAAGSFAAIQGQRAEQDAVAAREAEQNAEDAARVALAGELYASSITAVDTDPELAILLALEANALGEKPSPDATTALHRAVQASRSISQVEPHVPSKRPTNVAVALSPDGTTLFTSTDMASVEEWDVVSGSLVRTLGTPRDNEHSLLPSLAVSSDGRRLAVVDEDAVIHVWDLAAGTERQLQAPGFGSDVPLFSADGRRLVTMTPSEDVGLGDPLIALWDLESGADDPVQVWRLPVVWTVAFHPDGERVIATSCPCNPSEVLWVLDPADPEPTLLLENNQGITDTSPTSAAFNPDGTRMATAGRDGKINIWNTASGVREKTLVGHSRGVTFMAFSADGSLLASTSNDGSARVWDVQAEEAVMTLAGQGGSLGAVSFSADGLRLATGSSTFSVRVWDLSISRAGEVSAHDFGPPYEQVRELAAEGTHAAALLRPCFGFCAGTASWIDLTSGDRIDIEGQHIGAGIGLSPDGRRLASEVGEGDPFDPVNHVIQMYDLPSGEVLFDAEPICSAVGVCIAGTWQVGAFAFSADGAQLAATAYELDVSRNWLAIWDAQDGRLVRAMSRTDLGFGAPAFSPDGSLLAVTTTEEVLIVDLPWLQEVARFPVSGFPVQFSPDGSLLAVGSASSATTIYNTGDWSTQLELPVNSFHLDFSPGGERLVTADTDGFMRVWDLSSSELQQSIPAAKAATRAFFVSEDHIVSDTVRGTSLLVVTTDPDELLEVGADRLGRSLTEEECQRYLQDTCSRAPAAREQVGHP